MTNEQEQPKPSTRDEHRIIFYALLEASMRYRESYFREDIEEYNKGINETYEAIKITSNMSFSQAQKRNAKVKNIIIENKLKQEAFNKTCYDMIDNLEKMLSPEAKIKFDNYSTAYALMCEELVKAKNTTEIIAICKAYNEGYLENVFSQAKAKEDALNQKYEAKDKVIHDGVHLRIDN